MVTTHEIGDNVKVQEDDDGHAVVLNTNGGHSVRITEDGVELESLHAGGIQTKEVEYVADLLSEVVGLGIDEYPTAYGDDNRGLRIRPNYDRELRITDVTIDAETAGDITVGLWEFDGDAGLGAEIDTRSVSVESGVQTIELGFVIPGDGDYYLGADAGSSTVSLSRVADTGSEFPIESELLTIVEGASPEAFVSPRSNYYYLFDIGVEETTPTTSSVSVSDSGALGLNEVETKQHNHVHYAAPGDLEAVLDTVSSGDRVHLYPDETYITSQEVIIPREVRLIGNGATVQPHDDHNVFFLEPDCHIKNLRIRVGHVNFTSKAIEINTERMGDTYHGGGGGTVIDGVDINGSAANMSGDGVYIRVGENQWYSANQHHQFNVSGMGNGLHVDVHAGGHANANIFKCSLWNNSTQLRHSGTGPFESQIISELDASDNGAGTEHMIVNEPDTGRTCMVYGKMYDPFNCSGDYLIGTINMFHHNRPHVSVIENSPNASGLITAQDRNENLVLDLGAGMTWCQQYYGSSPWLRFQVDTDGGRNFSDIMSFRMDTGQVRVTRDLVTNYFWPTNGIDLGGGASISTNSAGEIVLVDENGNTLTTGG